MGEKTRDRIVTGVFSVAALGMLGVFGLPLLRNEIYLEHDVGSSFVPLRYFYAQCLQAGESFLWIPNIFNGFYLQGEGQNGMTHPLHLFLYRFLPFTAAVDLEFIVSYPFMFLGTLLWLRKLELPASSAALGAFLFTFSGYSMSSWLWVVHIGVLAHLPWLLYCIEIALRSTKRKEIAAALCGVSLLTASAVLVGYPQMVYVIGLVEGLYTLFRLPGARYRWMIVALLVAKILGALCAGVQLLPTYDLVIESTRVSADSDFRMQQSLHPYNLFSLVNPYLFHQRMYDAHGYQGLYGGVVSTILVAWLLLRYRRLKVSRNLTLCFATVALLGALLTLGQYGYLYRWVSSLPIIGYFRGPPRHGAMFHAGWVGLAVLAFTELRRMGSKGDKSSWRELGPLFVLPGVSIALAILIVAVRAVESLPEGLVAIEEQFAPTINPIAGAVLMIFAFGAFVMAARGMRYGVLALAFVVVVDSSWYHLRHRTTGDFEEFRAAIDVPDAPPEYRIEPNWLPVYDVNGPMMKGYSMVTGLVSLTPERRLDYNVNAVTLQLAGAKWMRSRVGTNAELNAWAEKGVEWIEFENPMPRARLLTETLVSDDPNKDVYAIDYARVALVDGPLELPIGEPGTATVIEDRPGRITVRTEADTRQLLVLTEAYDDDWRVVKAGLLLDPIRAYGDFLAVVVEPGTHEIAFTFDPWSWRWGKRLSVMGLVLTFVLTGVVYRSLPKGA